MVVETREYMTKMLEGISEGVRSAMDAGQRTQETWFKAVGDAAKNPFGFEEWFTRGEKLAKECFPYVGRNMETFAQSCDASFRAGLGVFKTACDVAMKADEGDVYKNSRRILDAAFDATRTNFDAFGKASTRAMDHTSAFVQAACGEETSGKSATKSSAPK